MFDECLCSRTCCLVICWDGNGKSGEHVSQNQHILICSTQHLQLGILQCQKELWHYCMSLGLWFLERHPLQVYTVNIVPSILGYLWTCKANSNSFSLRSEYFIHQNDFHPHADWRELGALRDREQPAGQTFLHPLGHKYIWTVHRDAPEDVQNLWKVSSSEESYFVEPLGLVFGF